MAHRPNTNLTATVRREAGFTLVELMIALFISGLVMAALVTIYTAQTRAYSKHDDIADIQQNLRGALAILPREIRLAGCDPEETGGPGILVAARNRLQFTLDVRGNATNATSADGDTDDTDENIGYTLTARNNTTNATVPADSDNNGIIDSGGANWAWGNNITPSLGRQTGGAGGHLHEGLHCRQTGSGKCMHLATIDQGLQLRPGGYRLQFGHGDSRRVGWQCGGSLVEVGIVKGDFLERFQEGQGDAVGLGTVHGRGAVVDGRNLHDHHRQDADGEDGDGDHRLDEGRSLLVQWREESFHG